MSVKKSIRLVSSATVLVCVILLLVDLAFVALAPSIRGTYVYAAVQILFQAALAFLIGRRVIVIYC
jgi:hypothetical protein